MAGKTAINYIEFSVADISRSKDFYERLFGWTYEDYGPEYCEFDDGRIKGGFLLSADPKVGSPSVIFQCDDLEAEYERVKAAGATIAEEIFSFPGGRRFEFLDPDGHRLSVWTESQE